MKTKTGFKVVTWIISVGLALGVGTLCTLLVLAYGSSPSTWLDPVLMLLVPNPFALDPIFLLMVLFGFSLIAFGFVWVLYHMGKNLCRKRFITRETKDPVCGRPVAKSTGFKIVTWSVSIVFALAVGRHCARLVMSYVRPPGTPLDPILLLMVSIGSGGVAFGIVWLLYRIAKTLWLRSGTKPAAPADACNT